MASVVNLGSLAAVAAIVVAFRRHTLLPLDDCLKAYPIGYFHIDIAEVQTVEGKLYLCRH